MPADTLGGLLERRAERDGKADDGADVLSAPGDPERRYDAPRLLTDARKTGNFCRQLGVGPGRTVAIADLPTPESVLALFGAALLGATARFVPVDASGNGTSDEDQEEIDARVLIAPADGIDDFSTTAATKRIAYGARPEDPEVAYFERDVWSENPTFPPSDVSNGDVALTTSSGEHAHGDLVTAAERVVETQGLDPGIEVAVRAPLSDPRTVVAGVCASLACGGVILLPDAETQGEVAVVAGDGANVPEPTVIDVADVPLDGA
jgi:hypothetical protein